VRETAGNRYMSSLLLEPVRLYCTITDNSYLRSFPPVMSPRTLVSMWL